MDRKTQREWIVKLSYQYDFMKDSDININTILENHDLIGYEFIFNSIESIILNINKIDTIINDSLNESPIDRLNRIDRSILRVSVNEFVIQKTVPTSVSINEAVNIAKKYSNKDSYKLINGVLSKIAREYS